MIIFFNRRDHSRDALARGLIERLYDEGVSTVYVGALTDVLDTHWPVKTNAKTHNFWALRAFVTRLAYTAEEDGIPVEVRSEAWTSQECPNCGSTEDMTRHRDRLTCPCGFEGHTDLTVSETFLKRQTTVKNDAHGHIHPGRGIDTERSVGHREDDVRPTGGHRPAFRWAIEWTRHLATDTPSDVEMFDEYLKYLVAVGFADETHELR